MNILRQNIATCEGDWPYSQDDTLNKHFCSFKSLLTTVDF